MKKSLLCAIVAVLLLALGGGCGKPPAPATHVLFIGNSYTAEHNLPQLFADLAQAGGHPIVVDVVAVGGATLAQHLAAPEVPARIAAQPWEIVVLQEQSILPALATQRVTAMYPAARKLTQLVRQAGARPVLLLTWGRRDGLPEFGFRDFDAMQTQLTKGSLTIADELQVTVAPAGEAWRRGIAQDAGLALWQSDGSHPSLLGSYLTACVLYATIFGVSPVGLAAPNGVSPKAADHLQQVANTVVLDDPTRWHIPK